MLIRTHQLPLLSAVLVDAAARYREALGGTSATAAMLAELAALVNRGGRMNLDEIADERPKRKALR